MKRLSTLLVYICYIIYLTGCGSSGGGGSDAKAAPADPGLPSITQPTPSPGGGSTPQTFSATYYTLVKNATVSQGGHSYQITMTGHCVSYLSNDYCWDDGWQSIPQINYETDFWQLCKLNGVVGQCSGGGSTDPVAMTPTLWSSMAAHLPTPPYQPADVYQGIATQVTCSLTGAIVDCVDFQIDTAQAPL